MINSSYVEYEDFTAEQVRSEEDLFGGSGVWRGTSWGRSSQVGEIAEPAAAIDMGQIFAKYQAAKLFCPHIEEAQLRAAAAEITRILNSGIFPDFTSPHVSVDEYGEFSVSLRQPDGYLDIGVCGDGEISFHVRNDADASKTAFGDVKWDGVTVPEQLIEAAVQLVKI